MFIRCHQHFLYNLDRDLEKYLKAYKKESYPVNKGTMRVLDSLYTENKTWAALNKSWKGYIIGKNLCQTQRARYYAKVIQNYSVSGSLWDYYYY